ncbi:MAG: hypothetical protein WA700_18615, partial [Acidobacteriaceae bacterium]
RSQIEIELRRERCINGGLLEVGQKFELKLRSKKRSGSVDQQQIDVLGAQTGGRKWREVIMCFD